MSSDGDMLPTRSDDVLAARLARLDVGPVPQRLLGDALAEVRTNQGHRRRRRVLVGVGIVALAAGILAGSPAGATFARAVLPPWMQQRFGFVVGAPPVLTPPCTPNPAGVPAANRGLIIRPNLSLAEAQQYVAFPIPTPQWLPPSVSFQGALAGYPPGSDPNQVYLFYGSHTAGGGVGLNVNRGAPPGGSAVPSSSAQAARVDGHPAYFVHGSYEDSGPCTPAHWNPNADDEELTWYADGYTYNLTVGRLHLEEKDVIRIAESVR